MTPRAIAFLAACTAAVMTGCGQKGPLYLPDKGAAVVTIPPVTAAPAPATTAKPKDKSADPKP
ncbi:MAG: lipoprotein [Steroidobacterales bacterium]|jgi:predicted small lipoprotein YifL